MKRLHPNWVPGWAPSVQAKDGAIQDDLLGQTHHASPAAWAVLRHVDGRNTVQRLWNGLSPDEIPPLQDVLSQLDSRGLLQWQHPRLWPPQRFALSRSLPRSAVQIATTTARYLWPLLLLGGGLGLEIAWLVHYSGISGIIAGVAVTWFGIAAHEFGHQLINHRYHVPATMVTRPMYIGIVTHAGPHSVLSAIMGPLLGTSPALLGVWLLMRPTSHLALALILLINALHLTSLLPFTADGRHLANRYAI